jgi:alkylation response protein AidB-like acyl-CoA dehydrogenase
MRFALTEEQEQVRAAIRDYVATEIEPVAADLDRAGAYPADVLDDLAEQGVMGMTLPAEHGGMGYGLVTYALVVEELAVGLMAVPSAINVHVITATLIDEFGTDSLTEAYLADMAAFDVVGAFGLTEPEAGSDNASMATRARKEGDEWVIDGQKRWITNSPNADVVSVFAKTGPQSDRHHNISVFLVPTDADGFEVGTDWDTLGLNSLESPDLHLDGVRVPEDHLIGERDQGFMHLVRGLNVGRINVAARCTGLARAALEDSVDYAREREQFGRPVGKFQGLRWTVADMALRTDVSRLLTLRAADLAERGADDRGLEASMAKLYASEAAVENALEGIQIHGGYGYTTEYDVERYLRDAKLLTIGEGTNEIHRDIIADRVFEAT